MADSSKRKWFPWRRRSQALQTPRPESREVAAAQVTDKYSEYPSDGLTPVRLAEIFKEADAGDVLRQAELFEEMEEKDPHLFSQLQTRKNAVTGLDYEVIPFDSDDPRDKEIAEFVEAQLGGIEGFEEQEIRQNKAIRGYIVRALAKGNQNSLLVRQVTNALLADNLITVPDISKQLSYLEDGGYIEFTDRRATAYNAYRRDAVIQLTKAGVDLVEGTRDDPGVDV